MSADNKVPDSVAESATRCLNDAAAAISSLAALAASVGSGGHEEGGNTDDKAQGAGKAR